MIKNLIIDFDSTIVSVETMEELFRLALGSNSKRLKVLDEVARITDMGMNGDITFSQSLARRVDILPLTQQIVDDTAKLLSSKLSEGFVEEFDKLNAYNLHVFSGGFKEIITPVLEPFGVDVANIYANSFIFSSGIFQGIDTDNPMAHDGGKARVAKKLQLQGKTVVIGDGYTDFQIVENGVAEYFIYYNEFANRPKVANRTQLHASTFSEVISLLLRIGRSE
ncbi:MAG: HAD-IB family phosphatase [Candidatus Dojkabacteria bacterium]